MALRIVLSITVKTTGAELAFRLNIIEESILHYLLILLYWWSPLSLGAETLIEPQTSVLIDNQWITSADGVLSRDAISGDLQWRALPGRHLFELTATEKTLYVGSTDGLFAIDRRSGQTRWHIEPGKTIYSPILVGDTLYSGTLDGRVIALHAGQGTQRWQRQLSGWVYTPAWSNGQLYTGGSAQTLWALSPDDGHSLWQHQQDQELVYRPAASSQGVLVSTFAGTLTSYSTSGSRLWHVNHGVASNQMLTTGQHALLGGLDGYLRLISLDDGRLIKRTLVGRLTVPPRVHGRRLLVTDSEGVQTLYVLDNLSLLKSLSAAHSSDTALAKHFFAQKSP